MVLDKHSHILPVNRALMKYVIHNHLTNRLHSESQQLPPDFQSFVDFMNGYGIDEEIFALMSEMERVDSAEQQKSIFENLLVRAGTNVKWNKEQDGDGDQRPPSTACGRQILRTLWFKGGDIDNFPMWNSCPTLIRCTIHGDATEVRTLLESLKGWLPMNITSDCP